MYLAKTPDLLKPLYKDLLWHVDTTRKELFLTFDDGPIPEVTPWVLQMLRAYNAKATFFCIGKNLVKHKLIHKMILKEGHSLGNHTYDHLNGWRTSNRKYFRNVLKCQEVTNTDLFRPPYGKLRRDQASVLLSRFRIVMWDVLSGDFDLKASRPKCVKNVVDNAGRGAIIVFHDSIKARERMQYALPRVLEYFSSLGYAFRSL